MKKFRQTLKPVSVMWILLFMIAVLATGCASSKNLGKDKLSDEASKAFESFEVLPDHHYYYCGSNVKPDGILAIQKSYTLSEGLWIKTEPDNKKLKHWVETMQGNISSPPYGYYLLTPDGKQIGMIYTRWDPGAVEMLEDNKVSVHKPRKGAEKSSKPSFAR